MDIKQKEQRNKNALIKLFQDLRKLVKSFSILALRQSLVLTIKGYLCYKTNAQLMNFFI